MKNAEVYEATLSELQRAMEAGRTSSADIVQACMERIDAFDSSGPALNAMAYRNPTAGEEARKLDFERQTRGARGPLHGIPILVKDNYDIAGWPTQAGCRGLDGLVADRDAEVIARLRAAGTVFLGKTNLHELAAGIMTVSSAHGRTRNPYDPTRNPGGSSGGTSAAVSASFAPIGLGSDTCGSIRIPAAQCSLYGLRVTQGQTPMSGVVPLCLTQDTLGPIARSVRDLASVLDVMVDPEGMTSFTDALDPEALSGRRIGKLATLFTGADSETDREGSVCRVVDGALDRMKALGCEIVELEIPELSGLLDENFLVILGDVAADVDAYLKSHPTSPHKSLSGLSESGTIHPEVAPVIAAAVSAPIRESPEYAAAIANRSILRGLLNDAMDRHGVDVLCYPPILQTAVELGQDQPGSNAHASANSGLPAIVMPAGYSEDGLPIGVELLGREGADAVLVAMAYAWETHAAVRIPPASTPPLVDAARASRSIKPGE